MIVTLFSTYFIAMILLEVNIMYRYTHFYRIVNCYRMILSRKYKFFVKVVERSWEDGMSHLHHCDLFPLSGFIEYVVVLPENLGGMFHILCT